MAEFANQRIRGGFVLVIALALASALSLYQLIWGYMQSPQASILSGDGVTAEKLFEKLGTLTHDQLVMEQQLLTKRIGEQPLDNEALGNLAILYAIDKQVKPAETLAIQSADRSFHNTQLQLRAINLHLGRKEFEAATTRIDSMLRVKPTLEPQLFDVLEKVLQQPAGLQAVAKTLSRSPKWRSRFLHQVLTADVRGESTFQLASAMRKANGGLLPHEVADLVTFLVDKKQADRAYFYWLDHLDEARLRTVGNVFDGGFNHTPQNQYFDWTLTGYPNSNILVSPRPDDPKNTALKLEFIHATTPFGHVRQFLRLGPGKYNLTGQWYAPDFDSPTGLRWRVYCHEGALLGVTGQPLEKTASWSDFQFSLEVPPAGCETQFMQLESASDAALDQRYNGAMYIDNLAIRVE